MTSLELDLIASQIEDADATDLTKDDDEEESTDMTIDDEEEEIRMDADHTDTTVAEFIDERIAPKIPQSEIVVRDIAIASPAPLAALPADTDAAFGQWLAGSGLSPRQ